MTENPDVMMVPVALAKALLEFLENTPLPLRATKHLHDGLMQCPIQKLSQREETSPTEALQARADEGQTKEP